MKTTPASESNGLKITIGTKYVKEQLNETKFTHKHDKEVKPKPRKNKCDLGPNFVAPDSGWAWLVCIAAGCSNLCTFPVLQQFGLLFAERLKSIGLTASEITTIINLNPCITSCMGLLNGPMFRMFTYRQVALFGALLVAFSIYTTSISNSFTTYLITFSILYGAGSGINSSASSLALNTYFKEKRRIATGLSWTLTGMGPILMPQLIALLLPMFGVSGCLLIFTGIALNAVVCALIFQPVQWHVKNQKNNDTDVESKSAPLTPKLYECDYCRMTKRRNRNIITSQYLYNADDAHATGYEIIDPGLPMLSLANDGWSSKRSSYGSRSSLYSDRASRFSSRKPSSQNLTSLNRSSSMNMAGMKDREKRKISTGKIEEHPEDGSSNGHVSRENVKLSQPQTPDIGVPINPPTYDTNGPNENPTILSNTKSQNTPRRKISTSNTFNVEKEVLRTVSQKLEEFAATGDRVPTLLSLDKYCMCDEKLRLHLEPQLVDELNKEVIEDEMKQHSLWQKIVIFFDLNLLRDFTYVNLMAGVTLGNFAELNFSILTPFVLTDWGFTKHQIATAMSLLGGVDIAIRFFIPFIAGKIGWENKTFFLVGIIAMAMGRIFITIFNSYTAILCAFCWIGLGKGLRTVFMALVIPSYVPLHRLPAASGLQLIFAGIFYFFAGPVVGYIRDRTDYVVTLHCLNLATYLVAFCWIGEKFYHSYQERKFRTADDTSNCDYYYQKANGNE